MKTSFVFTKAFEFTMLFVFCFQLYVVSDLILKVLLLLVQLIQVRQTGVNARIP